MFCTKCGQQINENASFCVNCGNKVEQTQPSAPQYTPPTQYAQPPQYAPPQQYAPQPQYAPKKSKTGLIVGLCAGAVVIAAVLVVLFVFVFPGGDAELVGKWYDTQGYSTIDFAANNTLKISSMGFDMQGNYNYDTQTKRGKIDISFFGMSDTSDFYIEDGILHLNGESYSREAVTQKNIGDMFEGLDFGNSFNMDGGD